MATVKLRRTASMWRTAAAGVLAAVTLGAAVACSSGDDGDSSSGTSGESGDGNFPVTVGHVYGETEIPEKPERVVTIGWITHDIVAALGAAPVGVDETWGGDDEGFTPWFRHQVQDVLGADMPETTNRDDGTTDIEKIATLKPDLILAPHSGVTADDYSKLSSIAPTVAYQEKPWQSGNWQDLTRTVAKALGEDARATELISETGDAMAAEAAKHPQLAGKNFLYGLTLPPEGSSSIGIYVSGDPRVAFLREFGLVDSPSLKTDLNVEDADSFYGDISLENLQRVKTDLFVGWSGGHDETEDTLDNPAVARWEPVKSGHYYLIEDETLASATNAPSPLSIRWSLDQGFLDDLASAVDGGAVVRPAR